MILCSLIALTIVHPSFLIALLYNIALHLQTQKKLWFLTRLFNSQYKEKSDASLLDTKMLCSYNKLNNYTQKWGEALIRAMYESGMASVVYYSFHVLGFLAVALFNLWYCKKYGITRTQALLTTLVVYAITYVWIYILSWAESGFREFGGNNIVRGFVYIPLIAWPVGRLFRIRWSKLCDFIAPCVCLAQGVSHIGCIFTGCCHGFECSWGIYHGPYQVTMFPIQLFESLTALLIVVILVLWAKKTNYVSRGVAFPWMLVMFGSTRFLWEFGRVNLKILWGCSSLAFHALFMAVVGAVLIVAHSRCCPAAEKRRRRCK